MAAKIFNIASHAVESVDKSVIDLSEPSIVQLQFGPEDVRAFDRVGTNLKITLLDGRVIVLEDFFVHAADGERSELVLIDDDGVMWWGQYGEQWNGFHFAEIEGDLVAAIPPWLWAGLGLLGAGAVAAGLGGGGGGDDSSDPGNNPPVATDDAGANYGKQVDGNVLGNDSDPDGDSVTVTGFSVDTGGGTSETFLPGETATIPGVGTITIGENGDYTFTPESGFSGNVPPVDYTITDGNGGEDTGTLTITGGAEPTILPDDGNGGGVQGHVTVDEAGLPQGSSAGDGSASVDGTISVSADHGMDSITIGSGANAETFTVAELQALSSTNPSAAITVAGGTLIITGFTASSTDANGVPTAGKIFYSYTLGQHEQHDAPGGAEDSAMPLNGIPLEVSDVNGVTSTGSLVVNVLDDVPTAADDSDSAISSPDNPSSEATGNVFTGVDVSTKADPNTSDGNADIPGADGATVTGIAAGNTVTSFDGSNLDQNINGDYGTLTFNSDGSYRYVPNYTNSDVSGLGPKESITDTFTYQIKDGDGDTDTATLDITIYGTPAIIDNENGVSNGGEITDGAVYEANLTDGTDPSGTGETLQDSFLLLPGANGLATTATVTGATTGTALEITLDGNTYTYTKSEVEDFGTNQPTLTGKYGTFQITGYDSNTREVTYTYKLTDTADHSTADVNEKLTLEMWDGHGNSTGHQPLNIAIIDDSPVIDQTGADIDLTVDESDLATDASHSFAGLFDITYGADHAATPNGTQYTLGIGTNGSGLVDTLSGDAVVLSVSPDGTTVTGTAAGNTVLTITIAPDTGIVTLGQQRAVKHTDTTDPDDSTTLTSDAVNITATATDGDGDTATSNSVNIGDSFTFKDDGPSITVDNNQVGSVELDETNLTESGLSTTVSNFAAGVFTPDYGADKAASTDPLVYSLQVDNSTSGLTDTLTGEAIVLQLKADGTVEGYTENSNELVFSVEVDAHSGDLTLTHYRALQHPDSGDPDDVVKLDDGSIQLVATATDGDGDQATQAVDIGAQISFRDDGPVVDNGKITDAIVKEASLDHGSNPDTNAVTQTGTLGITPSADGIDTTLNADNLPTDLKSGGEPVSYWVSEDGHTLIGYTGSAPSGSNAPDAGKQVFTVKLTDPTGDNPGYDFTLQQPIDQGGDTKSDLQFGFTVTDGDEDSDAGSFIVTVEDDAPTNLTKTVDEDGSVDFNTTADATPDNVHIYQGGSEITGADNGNGGKDYTTDHGTVTVNADGSITYEPDENYSGDDDFKYEVDNGDGDGKITVDMTVDPVADKPSWPGMSDVQTDEDTAISLGLKAPEITDDGTGAGNNPTSELLGPITLSGIPTGAQLLDGAGDPVKDGSGTPITGGTDITIVLSDGYMYNNASGDLTMTVAEFEALQVLPPAEDHHNFDVTVSVDSYEVDGSGNPLPDSQVGDGNGGVNGATSSETIAVKVQAVTDPVELKIDGGDNYDLTVDEDSTYNLKDVLTVSYPDDDGNGQPDTDGSEHRWFEISGLPEGTVVNGTVVGSSGEITIEAPDLSTSTTGLPDINVTPPPDFSGDLTDIKVTLKAQDLDSDGPNSQGGVEKDTVTLDLHVNPVANDVKVEGVETEEDTAVAFLSNVEVTDTNDGSEVIDSVSFELPSGWVLTDQPASSSDWSISGDGSSGSPYEIIFDSGVSENARETILDGFKVTPPAHSSADETISLKIQTTDSNSVNGSSVSDTQMMTHDVKVTVTPQAEIIDNPVSDTDGDGNPDLTMHGNETYTATAGEEDEWFELNGSGIDLSSDWSNEDGIGNGGSEKTYAHLTPVLVTGDHNDATIDGAQFRWSEDGGSSWQTATYSSSGSPIDVPIEYLDTLQFKAPEDASGDFKIKVQAKTVDTDPDDGSTSTEISGEAWLDGIHIDPVADDVTLALNGHASGVEDTQIPLDINPTSSDPSETFNVTIADIPEGAEIWYKGSLVFTATSGTTSYEITDFDSDEGLAIKPPKDSNDEMTLKVSAESVDGTDTSLPTGPLDLVVGVKGDADTSSVATTDEKYAESDLDGATSTVKLSDLATVELTDTDGSETLTVRVTGLSDGFSPSEGTLLDGSATGEARVWVLSETQFQSATIDVPENYSGTVDFQVAGVSTENDGDSNTGDWEDVQFTVTPSPEAKMTTAGTIAEDAITNIGLDIVHQNGDDDETVDSVRIEVSQLGSKGFTLYLGEGQSAKTLAQAESDGDISKVTDNGKDYYVLDANQVEDLAASGNAHEDGSLGSFDFEYKITDDSYGTEPAGNSATSGWQSDTFDISAAATTDAPKASITGIDAGSGSTSDDHSGDDATPDTVTLSQADKVTVTMHVDSPDTDGSEHLVRVVIDGVPEGVTVQGAEFLGNGQWLMIHEGSNAQSIGNSGLDVDVTFDVSSAAGGLNNNKITLTAKVQDNGNDSDPGTAVEKDSVSWQLNTNFTGTGSGEDPAVIDQWEYNDFEATEDTPFQLSDMIDAEVTPQSTSVDNVFTVTITEPPAGTQVQGINGVTVTHTVIDGKDVWTASTSSTGGNADQALADLLAGVQITPPVDSNNNNANGAFDIDATLTTSVAGGGKSESAHIDPTVPVTPDTDEAIFDIHSTNADLDEADSSIPITIEVSNDADGTHGHIVDGKLYLQLSSTEGGLGSGSLTVDGSHTITTVTNPSGLPAGDYYVIDNVSKGDTLKLEYEPNSMTVGDVEVKTWVQNYEDNSEQDTNNTPVLSEGSETITVAIGNDGVTVTSGVPSGDPIGGNEAADNSSSSFIELSGLDVQLNDSTTTNGSAESIQSVLLSGVPNGFLVYVGTSAESATLANNAGDDGNGNNTWVLANGELTDNVYILPPQHWSGTLSGLDVVVQSGESGLTESRVDTHTLADVTVDAVADGIVLNTTNTFGQQGEIIPFNLNASMNDPDDASVAGAADGSQETTTLAITGMGVGAEFFLNNTALDASQVSYDSTNDIYTVTDLSQQDVFDLGFRQSQAALTDQDAGTTGTQIGIEAWTVEQNGGSESTHANTNITVDMAPQLASAGDDVLYWDGSALDGLGGNDTVKLQQGDVIAGADLGLLTNVESIDLGVPGGNKIGSTGNGLTAQDVADILGSGPGDTLTILGDSGEDTVYLDSSQWSQADSNTWTSTVAGISVSVDVLDDDLTGPGPHVSAV